MSGRPSCSQSLELASATLHLLLLSSSSFSTFTSESTAPVKIARLRLAKTEPDLQSKCRASASTFSWIGCTSQTTFHSRRSSMCFSSVMFNTSLPLPISSIHAASPLPPAPSPHPSTTTKANPQSAQETEPCTAISSPRFVVMWSVRLASAKPVPFCRWCVLGCPILSRKSPGDYRRRTKWCVRQGADVNWRKHSCTPNKEVAGSTSKPPIALKRAHRIEATAPERITERSDRKRRRVKKVSEQGDGR